MFPEPGGGAGRPGPLLALAAGATALPAHPQLHQCKQCHHPHSPVPNWPMKHHLGHMDLTALEHFTIGEMVNYGGNYGEMYSNMIPQKHDTTET